MNSSTSNEPFAEQRRAMQVKMEMRMRRTR